jgi:hypothetical protein
MIGPGPNFIQTVSLLQHECVAFHNLEFMLYLTGVHIGFLLFCFVYIIIVMIIINRNDFQFL